MPPTITSKWEPATPLIKPDSLIISPQFRFLKPFHALYEKDPIVYMNYLLAWEYGRLWFRAHHKWEEDNYTRAKEEQEKKAAFLKRKAAGPKPAKKKK